jgi:hypothetical protein
LNSIFFTVAASSPYNQKVSIGHAIAIAARSSAVAHLFFGEYRFATFRLLLQEGRILTLVGRIPQAPQTELMKLGQIILVRKSTFA